MNRFAALVTLSLAVAPVPYTATGSQRDAFPIRASIAAKTRAAVVTSPAHRRAKGEPARGCYFSVFVGPDPSVRREMFARGGTLEDAVGRIVGKQIAVEWQYFRYDNPQEVGGYLQVWKPRPCVMEVALEPSNGLDEVREDAKLREYGRMFADYGRPLFLRFASEMNGNWTRWHGDPALYRAKFRLVHDVMERLAPNVIMIWCVSHQPQQSMDAYYPGDRYVDWVGVDFYSVLHHNADLDQPADKGRPTAMLDYVYRKYSARKPIAICEYAASREERIWQGLDRSAWAAARYTELLTALPKRYPRVKMVGLYNVNTMQRGFQSRSARANNFCFTDSPTVYMALRRALATDHYLAKVPEVR